MSLTNSVHEPPVIRALSEDVINRIAAGEVIQRPSSALKELLENSIDSNATQICITIQQGGFQLLQVQDNGHGIRQEDLPVLCKRHTTSKIRSFEDLDKIRTLGFRGEALCSISFVAKMTVTTRVAHLTHGYTAKFCNGELLSDSSKICAANPGTIISVEDLFYNDSVRRSSARSATEEFGKIMDVLQRYAIHCNNIGFSLKRVGSRKLDLVIPQSALKMERISTIYGIHVADSLLSFKGDSGYLSNVEFESHRNMFILFINDRCVECGAMKRAVDAVYTSVLSKPVKAFVYLEIHLPTNHVDVNIHPTKHEVEFLFKEELIQCLTETLKTILSSSDHARSFTQMKVTGMTNTVSPILSSVEASGDLLKRTAEQLNDRALPDYRLVRADPKQQSLQTCIVEKTGAESLRFAKRLRQHSAIAIKSIPASSLDSISCQDPFQKELREAKEEAKQSVHEELRTIIKDHSFVGMADQTRAFVQHQTKLYLIKMEPLSKDFFHWILLQSLGQIPKLPMEASEHVKDILLAQAEDLNHEEIEDRVRALIDERNDLKELFSIEILETGCLVALPCLLQSYIPDMDYLPSFFWKLSKVLLVSWNKSFCQINAVLECIAEFYAIKDGICETKRTKNEWNVKHVLLPAMRSSYLPSQTRFHDSSFTKVTSVEELYRRFGRC
eukprot:g6712.t1